MAYKLKCQYGDCSVLEQAPSMLTCSVRIYLAGSICWDWCIEDEMARWCILCLNFGDRTLITAKEKYLEEKKVECLFYF